MGAIAKHGTTFIVLINTFLGTIAVAFLALGVMLSVAPDCVDTLVDKAGLATQVKSLVDKMPPKFLGMGHLKESKLSSLFKGLNKPLIAIGVTLLCIVVWAYCGTCCKSRWMLIIYATILTAIVLGEVTVGVILATKRSMIDKALKELLKDSLTNFYGDQDGTGAVSLAWNVFMALLSCCGVDGFEDFESTKIWNNSVVANGTYSLRAPVMCCKTNDASSKCCLNSTHSCNKDTDYYQGCYAALWNLIEKNKGIAIGIVTGIGVFQIILLVLTVCVIKELGKSKKNKIKPSDDD